LACGHRCYCPHWFSGWVLSAGPTQRQVVELAELLCLY
jgi:hypothetical protein